MDVGLVVSLSGLIASAFALLAGLALAVELGVAPKKSAKDKPAQDQSKDAQAQKKSSRTSRRRRVSAKQPSADNDSEELLTDDEESIAARVMEKTIVAERESSIETMRNLQRTYVDGLLSPRVKYDVALSILNEHKATSVSEEEAGLLMATQAYLSATQTGPIGSAAYLFGGETRAKKTEEIELSSNREKNTQDTVTPKKTSERSRPSTKTDIQKGVSRKTTAGDQSESTGETRSTARNTNRKNTRPE